MLVPEESVLKFTLTYTAGAASDIIRLDSCGAHGVIDRIRVWHGSNVESSAARSYRSNIQPQNETGTYNAGDTITINIPTRNNLVLVPEESVLKFTLNYTAGAANDIIR